MSFGYRVTIRKGGLIMLALLFFLFLTHISQAKSPRNFLVMSSDQMKDHFHLIKRYDIEGVQIVYNWKVLEKAENQYDFSLIEKDLELLTRLNKKLFIQIQDRFFDIHARNIPSYLLTEPIYKGGLVPQIDNPGEGKPKTEGWVTMQWNSAVRNRFQQLLKALAERFDGKIYGINLPETSIDIDMKHDAGGFTCDAYFEAEISNMKFARKVFRQSYVVQYVNFFPCEWNNDHQFMSRIFQAACEEDIGLGGPDIVPNKKGQTKNAYPFFNSYKGKLTLVAMAVQEPTLTYTNFQTKKPFTKNEFIAYAEDFLGVDIIFWSPSSPWLYSK